MNRLHFVRHPKEMYDVSDMTATFSKRRLVTAILLVIVILSLVTACSLLNSPPIASFTFHLSRRDPPCVVTFDASSSHDPDNIIVEYKWSFGDGAIGSGESTSYTYTVSGTYAVNLTVTDSGGKTSSVSETITVMPPYNPSPPTDPSPPPSTESVSFPDLGLEVHIRNAIAKPTGDIYASDLVELTRLIANRGNCYVLPGCQLISSLEGIQHCTNLTHLWLEGNQISDISALSGLTNLTYLRLDRNQISNISALSGLINLTHLGLWSAEIGGISALSGLTNLTELGLYNNRINDISALSELTNLTVLELHSNNISDISTLSRLTKLTKLMLDNNPISDIQALVSNTGLGAGDLVFIRDNNLDLMPGSDDMLNIQILEGRGVYVYIDPQ